MIKEKILKKFLNTKNNVYYTRCKKGLLPFFYNGLQDFAAKLKISHNKQIFSFALEFAHHTFLCNNAQKNQSFQIDLIINVTLVRRFYLMER